MIQLLTHINILTIFLLLPILLFAQEGEKVPEGEATGQTFVYQCTNHPTLTVRIEKNTAWVFLPTGTIDLPKVTAASGAKYQQGDNLFWVKGQNALLKLDNTPTIDCQNDRKLAIWEDAKFRGIDFRAVGNEPGWSLEISKDNLVFITDYGEQTRVYPNPTYTTKQEERTTTFTAYADSSKITIFIKGKPCQDSMSDESFETSVEIITDEEHFSGCGKALH